MFLSFAHSTLSSSMRKSKFLPRPILLESDWNGNLKFRFLGQYSQKTIFQTKWRKNTDVLKIYLAWFSSKMWREQFSLQFFAQNIWKLNVTKYLYVIVTSFQFKAIYMSTTVPLSSFVLFHALLAWLYFFFIIKREPLVGDALIEIESALAKQTKCAILFLPKHSTSDNFLHHQMDI